jgi:tetratricopeptide (TPR) repeat protein
MGVLAGLMRDLGARVTGRRTWTPAEVRDMLDRKQIDEAGNAVENLAPQTPQRELVILCLRGEIAYRRHDDVQAEKWFREALAQEAGLPDAHYGLSLVMLARGEKEVAVRHAQFAVNSGSAARFSAQLGHCHLELGNIKRAGDALYIATSLDPSDKGSWNNLGVTRRAVGDMTGARAAFARALEIDPTFQQAAANASQLDREFAEVGAATRSGDAPDSATDATLDQRVAALRALVARGELSSAVQAAEALCVEEPGVAAFFVELSRLHEQSGDSQSAFDVLRAFQVQHPDELDVTAALGQLLVRMDRFKQASPLVERALEARPDDVDLLLAMAEIYCAQSRYEEADPYLKRSAELAPSIHMKGRLAGNLSNRCRYEESLRLLDEMIAEDPAIEPRISGMRCNVLAYLGRYDELLPQLEREIERNPNDPFRRFARSQIHLLHERFEQGWADYAYRNIESTKHLRMLPFPLWDGSSLEGKSIVVLAEQGLGDQVMFASCLPDLLAMQPKRIIVEAVDRVAPTLARSFPQCEVVASKQDRKLEWVRPLGQVDCFVAMGDLPRLFRSKRADFPDHTGYLKAAPERISHWRSTLDGIDGGGRPRIGVSWRGGVEATRKVVRSVEVTEFVSLQTCIDATWVCLQYGEVAKDVERANAAGLPLHYWPEAIKDLDDFAALISALDLVVTVCNTTVHYAGALAKPVWVLAPKIPEWRYGLHSAVMPWYPTSKMFRQAEADAWPELFDRVGRALNEFGQRRPD